MSPVTIAIRAWRHWRRSGRYWTFRKAANAALAHLAMRLRLPYVPAGPVWAKLEATNACNGTCVLCPVGRGEPSGRKTGLMRWELFCRLIDECASPWWPWTSATGARACCIRAFST